MGAFKDRITEMVNPDPLQALVVDYEGGERCVFEFRASEMRGHMGTFNDKEGIAWMEVYGGPRLDGRVCVVVQDAYTGTVAYTPQLDALTVFEARLRARAGYVTHRVYGLPDAGEAGQE